MFDARLRLMSDSGAKGRVLPTLDWSVTQVDSGSSTISLTVSEKISGRLDAPQVVAVEYSTGGAFLQPRGGLFVVDQDDARDEDPAGAVRFTGQDYLTWLMSRTYLHWAPGAVNGERAWTETGHPASAGTIIGGMIGESQGRGWGVIGGAQRVNIDFTWDKDSSGAAWTSAEKVLQNWRLLTPLSTILKQVTDQGLCDWWTEGMTLRLFRPGAGVTRDQLVFGGPGFTSRPTKSSFADVFTNLTVVPEKADNWLYLANPGASTRFGRLEATVTQSGVADHASATTLAQSTLIGGRAIKREYSFDWSPVEGNPRPWVDFNIGDVVTSKTRHGKSLQRVVGVQVSKRDELTVRAIVGDKLLSQAARQARKVGSVSIPGGIGGGGASFPIPDATFTDPNPPTGLHVASNVGSWRSDGTAEATVKVSWDQVTQTTDGSGVDVAAYELAVRTATSEPVVFATTEALSVTVTDWVPGVARFVKVRARDHAGRVSAWSGEISVVPVSPASIVPKAPTGLTVSSNAAVFQADGSALATVTVTWSPVTQSLDGALVDIAEYELQVGLDTQRVTAAQGTFLVPTATEVGVRVRARTTLGVWGDPSLVLFVTGAAPTQVTTEPTAPTLTTGAGGVFIQWGGTLTSGAVPTGGVFAEYRVGSSGAFVRADGPLSAGAGQVAQVHAPLGSVVQARLRWVDTLGRVSPPSAVNEITVVGITGPDVEVNSLHGNRVEAGSLAVDRVTPNFGQQIAIDGNVTITAINDQIAEQRLHYNFGPTGLLIGAPATGADVRVHPTGIQFRQNSVAYAWFEDGVVFANQIQVQSAQIGAHKWEKTGTGRTTLKPL